ncbi:hypothetical protein HanRHA438_Chr16g0762101 [Helianthus annuus]|nr:hypothetical protein HanRHA438_Chr16g0762101 [Helianthus annuus]
MPLEFKFVFTLSLAEVDPLVTTSASPLQAVLSLDSCNPPSVTVDASASSGLSLAEMDVPVLSGVTGVKDFFLMRLKKSFLL